MNTCRTFPLVALLAALAFTVLLSACGGGEPEDFDDAGNAVDKTTQPVKGGRK